MSSDAARYEREFLKNPVLASRVARKFVKDPAPADVAPKKSQATRLVEIAESVCSEFFHTPDRRGYAAVKRSKHREIWAVKSREFQELLTKLLYDKEAAAPNSEAVRQAINLIHAKAVFDGEEHPVYTRVVSVGDTVYLDLGDRDWRCVQITPNGWRVVPHPGGVRFRRASSMLPLPAPRRGAKIGRLWDFVNVRGTDRLLFAAWLLHACRASGPYPVLVVNGEQGSAKTTVACVVKSLLDPSKGPMRGTPKDERDLMIAAANSHLVVFDNISRLNADIADSLCRLATGGGLSTRQFYTDEDEIVFEAMRPIVLTGIEALAVRGDLADRAVVLNLPMLEQKRSESEFKAEFQAMQPELLGALLDVMCKVLPRVGATRLTTTPRMVDFARLGVAAERILGFGTGEFLSAYCRNREDACESILEASLVAIRLRDFMSQRAKWVGTASELLDALNGLATDTDRRRRSWPSTPNALGGALTRMVPSLRQVGIQIDRGREGHNRRRVMTICKMAKALSASSAGSSTVHPEVADSLGVTDSDPVADKADNTDKENPTLNGVEVREKEWEA